MSTSQEKGNALEAAVQALEETILRKSPNLKEKTYRIERKKLISVGGVRHEIDLFVTFELGPGYSSVFIFECKNWNDPVGKNEIIVFAEKIRAAGAQRGFFMAKSFTADAEAQAVQEPRMELKIVTEHDVTSPISIFWLHTISPKVTRTDAVFRKFGGESTNAVTVDASQAGLTLNGSAANLKDYLNAWVNEAMDKSLLSYRSERLTTGTYERECASQRTFAEGEFLLNGDTIEAASINVHFEVYVAWPVVKSHFDVESRGRVISFGPHTLGATSWDEAHVIFGPEPAK